MKNILGLFFVAILFASCQKEVIIDNTREVVKNCFEIDPFEVDWLQKTRNELILDSVGSPEPMKQSIVMYNYKGEYVFQVYSCPECMDVGTTILDCNKIVVCSSGGLTGENTCTDFNDNYTDLEIIYAE